MWKFLLLGLILAIWAYRRSRKAQGPRDFIDVKALNEAEEEVASWPGQSDWKIIANYESASGYNEVDLAEIVTYLGSKGVQATFVRTGVGIEGGAITTFVLKVPADQVEWAKQLLSEKDA